MNDVTIKAPPAAWPPAKKEPSPEELISILIKENDDLKAKVKTLDISLETIANVACSVVWLLLEMGCAIEPRTIGIPKEVSDLMKGAKIKIGEDKDRNVICQLTDLGRPRLQVLK